MTRKSPEYSRIFKFLPGTDEIKKESDIEQYDLAISLDCATIKMLNGFAKYFENAKMKVRIDNHGTNTMFGNYNYVNPAAPACAQILLVVLEYFGIEVTKDIGTCILTGIITDGDLRRAITKYSSIHQLKVSEIMTHNPKMIVKYELAAKALHIMEEYKISSLFIIDKNQHPEGIIHFQDLLKFGLV